MGAGGFSTSNNESVREIFPAKEGAQKLNFSKPADVVKSPIISPAAEVRVSENSSLAVFVSNNGFPPLSPDNSSFKTANAACCAKYSAVYSVNLYVAFNAAKFKALPTFSHIHLAESTILKVVH